MCKQTRAEGLAIFYQHHYFRFNVGLNLPYTKGNATFQILNASDEASHALPCKKGYGTILDWLERIGDLGRENIRNLKFLGHFDLADWQHMSRIHSQLSDKATVIYRPFDPSNADGLWNFGEMWESSDRREAPTFSIYEKFYDTYTDKPVFGDVSSCTLNSILDCHGLEEENKAACRRQPQKSTRRLGQWRRHEKNLDEFCGSRMTDFLQGHNILEDIDPLAME